MNEIELTKVYVIGEKFFNVFEMNDGGINEIEIPEQDYRLIGTPITNPPTVENGIWRYSYSRYKVNTINGDMDNHQYCQNGENYLLRFNDKYIQVKSEDISNDKITENNISLSENFNFRE